MNDNRSHDYDSYVNSYGMQEIRSEAGKARLLRNAESNAPGKPSLKQRVLQFAPVMVVIALLILFFG